MREPRNILAIVDPTAEEHPSVVKAAALAELYRARLELFVCDTHATREARLLAQRQRDPRQLLDVNLKPMLEALAAPLRARGIDVTTECAFADSLAHGLLDHIRRARTDLAIKDTHHHSWLRRILLSNTDWELIRHSDAPLLLVREQPWREPPVVLAAVDPGHVNDKSAALDHAILEWSRSLAARTAAALHVLHAYVPLTVAASATNMAAPSANALTPEVMDFEQRQKSQALRALAAPYGIEDDALHTDLGVASDMIPMKAQALSADVVVMGAVARSGLQKLLIGTTAERVLERLECDVLIVKASLG
jgi:universal stress protein E